MSLRPSLIGRLISRHGKECTFTKITQGTHTTSTSSVGGSEVAYTVLAHTASFNITDANNNSVEVGDRQFMLTNFDTSGNVIPKPTAGDYIEGVGDKARVKNTQEIISLGNIVYLCHCEE